MPANTKGSGSVLGASEFPCDEYRLVLGWNSNSEFQTTQTAGIYGWQCQCRFQAWNTDIQTLPTFFMERSIKFVQYNAPLYREFPIATKMH